LKSIVNARGDLLERFIEDCEYCCVAPDVVYGFDTAKEPTPWTDGFRYVVADAYRLVSVADKIVGSAMDGAHGAPISGRRIAWIYMATVCSPREHTRAPVRWVRDESTCIDQNLSLYGRGHELPHFIAKWAD
jgi:hypothetical protein